MLLRHLAALTSAQAIALLDAVSLAAGWPVTLAVIGMLPRSGATGIPALLYPVTHLVSLYALGLYRRDVVTPARRSLDRVPVAAAFGVIAAAGAVLLLELASVPNSAPWQGAHLMAAAFACFLVSGMAARGLFSLLQERGVFRRRLLVVGAGRRAWDLAWMLRKEGATLSYEIAFLHEPVLGAMDPRLADGSAGSIVHAGADGVLGAARRFGADQIVVAPDERRGMALESLLACKVAGFPVQQYLSFVEREIRRVDIKRMELGWLLYSEGFYFGIVDRVLKRGLDLAVSSVMLLALSPFLLAAMTAVKLDDRGPVFYFQERVTRNGRGFRIHKLRTMRVDAERQGAVWAASADARITRVGAFLRRTRLDEVPQLLNVLKGDMSLVGPRPERPAFVRALAEQIPLYRERHVVKAGLTG